MTEEERDDLPENIKEASIEERRIREKQFFENIKKTQQSHENETLYIVNTKWVKQWTSFLAGHGKCPSRISNKNLYNKYFVQGQDLEVSEDYYFMTERMWKFLYSIYGGGPIMKKKIQPEGKSSMRASTRTLSRKLDTHTNRSAVSQPKQSGKHLEV